MKNPISYRREIDGLRAIAVALVVLYHADITWFGGQLLPGGFIGVDVFFVISGYLITLIILRETAAGSFSFANFYNRRARRILPALAVVLLATIPFAWIYKLPNAFLSFTDSLLSAAFFFSNFYWWSQDLYTAESSKFLPLLHTWSLAVEEQFYAVFPALLLLIWFLVRRWTGVLILIGIVLSLALAEWGSRTSVNTGFYLIPFRIWELLAGAFLAHREVTIGRSTKFGNEWMPALGLLLICMSGVFFDDLMPHPSVLTALPVIGTMAVIWWGGGGDLASRVLSTRPFVAVGLVSYSFYLWHQPVLAFERLRIPDELQLTEQIFCILLSLGLACASWRFIEMPFRRHYSPKTTYGFLVGAAAVVVALTVASNVTGGFPKRYPPFVADLPHLSATGIRDEQGRACWNRVNEPPCIINPDASVSWVLLGDSMVRALSPHILQSVSERGQGVIELTQSGCHYAVEMVTVANGIEIATCTATIMEQRRELLQSLPPSIVLIHGNLQQQISGEYFDNREGGREVVDYRQWMRPSNSQDLDENQRIETVKRAVTESIEELLSLGHKVVLVYSVPEVGWRIPERILHNLAAGGDQVMTTSYDVFRQRTKHVYEAYDAVSEHPNLLRIYPAKLLCNRQVVGRCIVHDETTIYYADSAHLSPKGARLLIDHIMTEVAEKWRF